MTSRPGKTRVLVVDDEPSNLQLMMRTLRGEFETVAANNAIEARRILESAEGASIDVILTDQRMPQLTGTELLAWVADHAPRIRRVIVTAFADADAMLDAINRIRVDRFVLKPWQPAALLKTLHELAIRERNSPEALAEENARARIRQEILEERNAVLSRRAASLERAAHRLRQGTGAGRAEDPGEIDLLTGVGLSGGLREQLARHLPDARAGHELAVLAADVDDLEVLNQSRGADAGDAAIIDLADAILAVLGQAGYAARMRGGKFVACLPGSTRASALEAAENICRRYASFMENQAARAPHSASIGVAVLPTDASSTEELLMKADVALYTAKAGGKNRAVAY